MHDFVRPEFGPYLALNCETRSPFTDLILVLYFTNKAYNGWRYAILSVLLRKKGFVPGNFYLLVGA